MWCGSTGSVATDPAQLFTRGVVPGRADGYIRPTRATPQNRVMSADPKTEDRGHLGPFLAQLFRRPTKIVALAPSSSGLARAMVEGIGPDTGAVVELGSGTGKITDFILARGVPEDKLALFEINEAFTDRLRRRYPRAQLMPISAGRVEEAPFDNVGAVISGLPLLSMPVELQRDIVGGAFRLMRPGGIFVQFTYGFRPPVERGVREGLQLRWTRSHTIWMNLPPAQVYTFRQG